MPATHMQQNPSNNVMAAILKVSRDIKNPTLSTDAYLLKEQSYQISYKSDLKPWSLRLFWRVITQQKNKKKNNNYNNHNKISSDTGSVPIPKYSLAGVNKLKLKLKTFQHISLFQITWQVHYSGKFYQ